MRDYWLTQYVLAAVGWGYVALVVVALALGLWLPKARIAKAIAALVVVGLASILPIRGYQGYLNERQAEDEYRLRYARAKALFDERCKTAGEKIYRTVEGVEGVHLLKIRQYSTGEGELDTNPTSQTFREGYIRSFLMYELERSDDVRELIYDTTTSKKVGYRYVTALDDKDSRIYQYTIDKNFKLIRNEAAAPLPRYAVTFDDPVVPAERAYWIASTVTRVIDQTSQQVMGESIKYVFDHGLGSRAGQRTPWLFAKGCGIKTRYSQHSDRFFATQVLNPLNQE